MTHARALYPASSDEATAERRQWAFGGGTFQRVLAVLSNDGKVASFPVGTVARSGNVNRVELDRAAMRNSAGGA
jgi:hypothetical protein